MIGVVRGSTHDAGSLITDSDSRRLSVKASFGRSNALRNLHFDQTSEAGHSWSWKCLESTDVCQGHAATGRQHEFMLKNWDFKRRKRTILKMWWESDWLMTAPCSGQTGKRFRNSCTSQKDGPQTNQPTNKQTSSDLQISFTKWPSIWATATDLKIPQKMAWWPQTRLKSFFWVLYNQEPQKVTNSLLISILKNLIRGCNHDASSLNNDWDNLSLEAALDEVMPWETRILTKQAKLGTSGLGKYACQGHAATVLQHEFMFKYWRFNRRQRTILKM